MRRHRPTPLNRPPRAPASRAFTLVEVLVVIGIVALVVGLLLVALSRVRRSGHSVQCLANLQRIGQAFNQYTVDYGGKLPDPFASHTSWEGSLAAYLTPAVFRCPADQEVGPSVGSSYDWRDTGDPSTTLAGRYITEVTRPEVLLAFDALPGWHARKKVNVVRLDGAALTLDQSAFFADLVREVGAARSAATAAKGRGPK
jgi:type II secretory pathway pseudopilin PulG